MKFWMLRVCAVVLAFTIPNMVYAQRGTCEQGFASTGCETGDCPTGGCETGRCRKPGCLLGAGANSCPDGSFCGTQPPGYPVPFATPRPTVPTNLTYPPMYPHHSLPHYNGTYSYRHNCGLSHTNVHWHPSWTAPLKRIHHIFELPR